MDHEQPVTLTTKEQTELAQHEAVIERGLNTFVEVGLALMAIRDARLYRQEYGTFEAYCLGRWQITPRHGRRLIAAAEVVNNLGPMGPILPTTERQVRPLAQLEPEQQRETWAQAVETAPQGKPTAAHVQKVIDETILSVSQKALDNREQGVPIAAPETVVHVATNHEPDHMSIHYSSETPEHYTPQVIIDAALACMDNIDLDPCSNSQGNPNVPANRHFTREDDGLQQEWHGKVYMNPPYGREIGQWVEKLCQEHEVGRTTEAVALVPARTDTKWWLRLRDYPVCFIEGRLTFVGNDDPAPFPSAVFYLGNDIDHFYYAFAGLGDIWQRIEPGMFGQ